MLRVCFRRTRVMGGSRGEQPMDWRRSSCLSPITHSGTGGRPMTDHIFRNDAGATEEIKSFDQIELEREQYSAAMRVVRRIDTAIRRKQAAGQGLDIGR